MLTCQACGAPATRRVGLPRSPVAAHTFNLCDVCTWAMGDLDGATDVVLYEH